MLELGLALNRKYHLREDLIIDGIEIIWRDTQDLLIGIIIITTNQYSWSHMNFLMNLNKFCILSFCQSKLVFDLRDNNINTLVNKSK